MLSIRRVNSEVAFDAIRNIQELIFVKEEWCDPTLAGSVWWIAYEDKVPVGFIGIERWPEVFYVCLCGVLTAYRGRGIQTKMLKVVMKFASKTNAPEVVSDTAYHNVASMNSFINAGFKLYTPVPQWRAKGALFWRKLVTKVR